MSMPSSKKMTNSQTSTSQIPLQVLNTITNNRTVTLINDHFAQGNTRKRINNKIAIKMILLTLSIITFVLNFHFILFFDLQVFAENLNQLNNNTAINANQNILFDNYLVFTKCSPKGITYAYYMDEWWPLVDLIFTFLIPFMTITITFVFILLNLRRLNQIYLRFSAENSNKFIYLKRIQRNKLVLLKLFLVNFYFFLSVCCYFLFKTFLKNDFPYFNSFFTALFYSNNSLNILFYGVSCQTFRQVIYARLAKTLRFFEKKQ
jgi:hypothetical protein